LSKLEITLSFTRKTNDEEWESFNNSFTSDESLGPILEKIELFLSEMGFVTDDIFAKESKINLDFIEEPGYTTNITRFPTKED